MNGNQFSKKWSLLIINLIVISLAFSLPTVSRAAESGAFGGTWVANGTREIFPYSDDREVYTFELSGHVRLKSNLGKKKDYWARCIGLSDSMAGAVARCVWEDLDGAEIYITLQSKQLNEDSQVNGTIVGGSEQLEGITGSLSFVWSSVSFQKDGKTETVTGQTLGLSGTYQLP